MENNQVKYIVSSTTEEKSKWFWEPVSAEAGDQDSVGGDNAILKNSEEVLWFYTQWNIIAILNS